MWKVALLGLLAAVPSSTNYTLNSYGFGNGDGSSGSTNYNLRSNVGNANGTLGSTSYTLPAGVVASTTVSTPAAPTFTNPDSSYSRLRVTINPGTLPADTKFAIAISTNNFVTTNYVQANQTVGSSFTVANYQTYAAWGGAGGAWVLDLTEGTTYQVKVAALQGASSGSQFGPAASAATSVPSVTFGVTTSLTGTPPFSATFASLPAGTPTAANATVNTSVTTNAAQGGSVFIKSQNAGLTSSRAGFTLPSATADLSAATSGYGAQVSSTGQASGGPITASSPFSGTSNSVGALTNSWQQVATWNSPVTSGTMNLGLLAKVNTTVPSATDYSDVLTLTISLLF